MNFQQLENIVVLAKRLHFTQAADEANIVQPALSRQVRQLEEELGVVLFKRNKRNVELTAAGEYFTSEVAKTLLRLQRLVAKTQTIDRNGAGEIRVGFTYSVMQSILPEVLQHIRQLRPGMRTILKDANNRGQFEALLSHELDVGFVTNPVIPNGLMGKKLRSDNFVLLLPPDHQLSAKTFKVFSQFAEEEFIFPPESDGTNYINVLESICLDAGFKPKVTHITGSASTAFKLVEEGMGLFIEPARSLLNQELNVKKIELINIPQKADLVMIWGPNFEEEHPDLLDLLSTADYS